MAYRRTANVVRRLNERHDAIVTAAREAAAEGGMAAVQIVPVAERAGVAAGTVYRVVAGDTMSKIARTAKVSLDALLAANPKVHPDNIEIGQVLNLPITTYTVKAGDSWWAIASRHGTTHGALAALNGKTTADTIHPGDILRVA